MESNLETMDAKLHAILEKYVTGKDLDTNQKLIGASFAVVTKDRPIIESSAGQIDLTGSGRPFDSRSFNYIASLTKLITITCIMQLVERGTLPLDDDVRTTIPELGTMQILRGFDGDKPILEDNTKPITLRYCPITVPNPTPESARHVPKSSILTLLINSMLLTHVVGLGYDIPNPDLIKWSNYVGRTARNLDWSKEGFTVPFKFTPGEGWWGLEINHGLAGLVNLEDIPGKRAKGSMTWSGFCNSRWWIDRKSGIGAVLFTNVQPFGDSVVGKLYDELERCVYENLEIAP
ncbi:unnamed protein product [Clonostachys rosea f. rosea IK726]|nr:unnamed protein product [Clonostachys rosea f. rosea IK726]